MALRRLSTRSVPILMERPTPTTMSTPSRTGCSPTNCCGPRWPRACCRGCPRASGSSTRAAVPGAGHALFDVGGAHGAAGGVPDDGVAVAAESREALVEQLGGAAGLGAGDRVVVRVRRSGHGGGRGGAAEGAQPQQNGDQSVPDAPAREGCHGRAPQEDLWIFDREQSSMNRTARKERMSNRRTLLQAEEIICCVRGLIHSSRVKCRGGTRRTRHVPPRVGRWLSPR